MQRLLFASTELPAELSDDRRFSAWRDIFIGMNGSFDLTRLADERFAARFEVAVLGEVAVCRFDGTLQQMKRDARQAATSPREVSSFCFNLGTTAMLSVQRGREVLVGPGDAVLMSNAEGGEVRANATNAWYTVYLPTRYLRDLAPRSEDRVATPFDPANPATRHLRRYLDMLGRHGFEIDPRLTAHVGGTLVDLVALSLGVEGDTAELAKMHGLRAARLQLILAEIRKGYASPTFSPQHVARSLGLSPRYIRDLLHESSRSFTERVLDLRLDRACALLSHLRYDGVRIVDIAFRAGFGDVAHFNHCFRRRFGMTPRAFRAESRAAGR